jgi:Tfp pilus assembly protein PilE/ribosomal protein L40E
MYCPKCGTQNDANAYKCTKCGIVIQQLVAKKKTNTAIIVLVIAGIALVFFAVVGILAAIAIPAYLDFQVKARNAMARTEITNACHAAAAFFIDNPDKTITLTALKEQGVATNTDVEVSIENGTMNNLSIHARRKKGNRVYVADKNCDIQEIKP